jgi:hypothetical protein
MIATIPTNNITHVAIIVWWRDSYPLMEFKNTNVAKQLMAKGLPMTQSGGGLSAAKQQCPECETNTQSGVGSHTHNTPCQVQRSTQRGAAARLTTWSSTTSTDNAAYVTQRSDTLLLSSSQQPTTSHWEKARDAVAGPRFFFLAC